MNAISNFVNTQSTPHIQARPTLRPTPNKVESAPRRNAQDSTSVSRESRMNSADARRNAAWRKFNSPRLWRGAGINRQDVSGYRRSAHEAGLAAGKKGTRAYRDAYRRNLVDNLTTHANASRDSHRKKGSEAYINRIDAYGRKFQSADDAYKAAKESGQQPVNRANPNDRTMKDAQKHIDAILRMFN